MLVYLWISAQILFVTLHFAIDCIADSSIVQQWANFLILTASSLSKLCFWMISHEKNLHFGDARAFQMDWLNDVLAAPRNCKLYANFAEYSPFADAVLLLAQRIRCVAPRSESDELLYVWPLSDT